MKKYIFSLMVLLLPMLAVGFTACSDGDEPKGADIVGTWQYNHPDDEEENVDFDMFYQFTKDGVFHRVEKYYETWIGRPNFFVHHGTYVVSGTKLITTFDGVTTESDYLVKGNKLMFLGGDEPTFTRVEDSVIEPYL